MPDVNITDPLLEECIVKGYLVTHADGFEARLGPDRGRAEAYVRKHGATRIEPLFVKRPMPHPPGR